MSPMNDPSNAQHAPPGLRRLNGMEPHAAEVVLLGVCGSRRWAAAMAARRPFADVESLLREARACWSALAREDWLEAFSHHPRIGETNLAQPRFEATAEQSRREQSGISAASERVRAEFGARNAEYENRFGHVFLICATGKSGDEMLGQLRIRLRNDPETELRNAAEEQLKIVRLRLERLVNT